MSEFAKAKEYLGILYREFFLASGWEDSVEFKNTTLPILSAFGTAMSAIEECQEREFSCWYCGGIENHDLEYVLTYQDKLGRRVSAPEKAPHNYCATCGRKLKK